MLYVLLPSRHFHKSSNDLHSYNIPSLIMPTEFAYKIWLLNTGTPCICTYVHMCVGGNDPRLRDAGPRAKSASTC